jgi:hypothetical protein
MSALLMPCRALAVAIGDMSGLKADGRDRRQDRRDCCQYCCQAVRQRLCVDGSGMSAQGTASDGRSWTMCPLLRI